MIMHTDNFITGRCRYPQQPEVEICAGDEQSVFAAFSGGATRVEMCTGLSVGGLTPPASMLEDTKMLSPAMKRHVLIRPRPGDFLYSEREFMQMLTDVRSAAIQEADGIVFGILDADGNVDIRRCRAIIENCGDRSYTFHRAFDMTRDPFRALEEIIACGFDRILTSGCAPTAEEGIPMLRKLREQAGERIIIMAGGGINSSNAGKIMEETGIISLHASASEKVESKMRYRNNATKMSRESMDEYSYTTSSEEKVRLLCNAVNTANKIIQ